MGQVERRPHARKLELRTDDPVLSRDAGLRRIGRATRLLSAAAVTLIGVVTVAASSSQPGRSARAIRSIQRRAATHVSLPTAPEHPPASQDPAAPPDPGPQVAQQDSLPPQQPAPSNEGDPGLQPPPQAPAPTEAPAGPVSGGS